MALPYNPNQPQSVIPLEQTSITSTYQSGKPYDQEYLDKSLLNTDTLIKPIATELDRTQGVPLDPTLVGPPTEEKFNAQKSVLDKTKSIINKRIQEEQQLLNTYEITDKAFEKLNALKSTATKNLEKAYTDIVNNNIDMNRFFNQMPNTGKVLAGLSVILGSFTEGFSGGKVKNTGIQILEKAVEKDIEQQKIQLNQYAQKYELSKDQLGRLNQQFDTMANRKRELVGSIATLRLADLAEEEKDFTKRYKLESAINQLNQAQLDRKAGMKAAAAGTSRVSTTNLSVGKTNESKLGFYDQKQLQQDFNERVKNNIAIVSLSKKIKNSLSNYKWSDQFMPTSDFNSDITNLISSVMYMQTGKAATQQEAERIAKQIIPAWGSIGATKQNYEDSLSNFFKRIQQENMTATDVFRSQGVPDQKLRVLEDLNKAYENNWGKVEKPQTQQEINQDKAFK